MRLLNILSLTLLITILIAFSSIQAEQSPPFDKVIKQIDFFLINAKKKKK